MVGKINVGQAIVELDTTGIGQYIVIPETKSHKCLYVYVKIRKVPIKRMDPVEAVTVLSICLSCKVNSYQSIFTIISIMTFVH